MDLVRYQYPNTVKRFNTWMDRFLSDIDMPELMNFNAGMGKSHLGVDFYDDSNNYYMCFELPGVSKKDIDLKIENAVLTIFGGHEESTKDSKRHFSFHRSLSIPDDVNFEAIHANLENGLLTVTLPKKEASKQKSISID